MTAFERAVEAMGNAEQFDVFPRKGRYAVFSRNDDSELNALAVFGHDTEAHADAKRRSNLSRLLAALRVIREPSEAMIAAGCLAQQDPTRFAEQKENHLDDGDFARGTWFAMIDALLKEIGDG